MSKNRLSSLLGVVCSVFTALLGTMHWKSPPWVAYMNDKAKTSPVRFWGSALLCISAFVAMGVAASWYHNLPKPLYTTAAITLPATTPNEETLVPNPLLINFGVNNNGFIAKSVAPINKIGKPITEGLEISPKIAGQWVWNSDSQLAFNPEADWPANQQFTIDFTPGFFAANANMERHRVAFTTYPFQANITELKLYQDPVNSQVRNVVATIAFNYPVDPESLEKNTSLAFEAFKKDTLDSKTQPIAFSYTFDKNKRIAYLHSDTINITKIARFVRLTLAKEVRSSTKSGYLKEQLSKNVLIPDASTMLKVVSASATILRNDKDRPEQVLTIETSLGINESDFNQSVRMYLLPKDYPATAAEPARHNYAWQNPGEVTDAMLALATPLSKQSIPTEYNYSTLHSFKLAVQTPRYIYIKIDKGLKGLGDFTLTNSFAAVIPAPELPKEISFLHQGSLLALGGEKKLSVLIRGLPAVKFDFARVLPANVNQLVTQTQGDFNNPFFINPSFNQQNISQIFSDIQPFDGSDLTKQQYTALDLSKYLKTDANVSGPQGLFLLQATGWDIPTNSPLDARASRLILLTDLGLLVKDNRDLSHDVFVQSITQGTPVANITVTVLGKNGLPILSRVTDMQGRAHFPSLNDFVDERAPTVYLANLNEDVSFIPFSNSNRQLNVSKFDVGGIYTNAQELNSLSAYLFSDRGIYRPGDTIHLGMIVKQAYARAQAAGLPLQATITDSRGAIVKEEPFTLDESGYLDLDFNTSPNAPTGQYSVNLYLIKDNHPQNSLGSTTFSVAEFQPDRMRIASSLLPKPTQGWSAPKGLKASVELRNLYGAPAANRRISAKILLVPEPIKWADFPDYVFADPLLDPKKPPRVFSESLNDLKTDDKGYAEFDLNLDRFDKATYQLTFFAEGFEAEGGRSVTTQSKVLVSPLPYFVGYKADGDLSFIKQNAARSLHFIALNPQLKQEAVDGLKIQLVSLHPVTTLVKKADGTYQYQSIMQSSVVSINPFTIKEQGAHYAIPTQKIGNYALNILGKDDTVLSQLKFSVVGPSQLPLAKNAQLSLKLNKDEYVAGEDIEIQITAPYTGSGLITIERDKVYAVQWFKTQTTNSVQTIHLPADFEGNGYINVAFIRDWESPEIFISPLSYSIVPFEVSHANHAITIDLQTAEVARPGESFTIHYKTDKLGKIIVFAVDEGILQAGRYNTPDPLAFFFQKSALEVLTQQTVDQILPKFIQDRELSAAGGDGGEEALAGRLNPFKRKTDLPVAYWSGILDADTTAREVSYPIPDYFNGTLRVMAVAVSADSVGSNETAAQIRGDFIINPNVPTFVAPGDSFEITASIANNVKGSGEHAQITVELNASSELEVIGNLKQTLEISEGREQTVRYTLRAKSQLGSAKVVFNASSNNKSSTMAATLSVRPATPFVTHINSGISKQSSESLPVLQTLYPEYRHVEASASTNPLIFVFGLQRYLENFPYGCTEQLTSKALPLLAMNNQALFTKDSQLIDEKVNATIQMLSQRQTSNGGFSYWPGLGDNSANTFATVYAMHFLTEARAQGFNVPNDFFYNGISHLKELASRTVTNANEARIQAYAIYILTRNEIVTTNYLANLQGYLQQDSTKAWQKELTGAYIAASYQLLKSYNEANQLISQYQSHVEPALVTDFYDQSIADAQYVYLLALHFPDRLNQVGDKLLMQLVQAINTNEMNTVLSGYVSLALGAYHKDTDHALTFSMTQLLADNQEKRIPAEQPGYQKLILDEKVKQITFNNPEKQTIFYQLIQAGFNKTPVTQPVKQGIELFREYRDSKGQVVSSTPLGSEIEVHIQMRTLDNKYLTNMAIEDLLPGGFEVVRDSVKPETMDYFDIREDRVVFFGSMDSAAKEIVYKIKATNIGKYSVPPIYAEAMYNPNIKARGVASEMEVTNTK